MSTKISSFYEILSGPNKDALFDACKYAYDKRVKISIPFRLSEVCPTEIRITSIVHDDGSGDYFNLAGYCKVDINEFGVHCFCHFEAFYNTKNRKGRMRFIL